MKGDYAMYTVRVRIDEYRNEFDTSTDFATLYREARKLARLGRHFGRRTSVVISDWRTGKTVVRLYSIKSRSTDGWVAAQSAVGKYHAHIKF